MGDRWRPDLLGSSRYIWYPLDWSSGSPKLVAADMWSVNLSAGTYTAATGTAYEAESGTLSGSAVLLSGTSFSGGTAVGYLGRLLQYSELCATCLKCSCLGNGGSVTIRNVQGNGKGQWVALYYANGDSSWRNTTVR